MQLSSPERTFITYKITKQSEDRNNPTMLVLMATCKYCSVYGTFIGSESLGIVSITAKNQAAVAKILTPTLCFQDLTDRKLQFKDKELKSGCPCKTEAGGRVKAMYREIHIISRLNTTTQKQFYRHALHHI